jgi:hypothetical protein
MLKLIGLTTAILIASASANAVTIYTDRTTWEAAVAGFNTETFDNTIANANSIVLDNGIVSTANPGLLQSGLNNVDSSTAGRYVGRVGVNNPSHPDSIDWTLTGATNGFFGDFGFLNANGLITLGGFDGGAPITIDIASIIGSGGGFGIVGDANFSAIRWSTQDQSEYFSIDNFSVATVPEPGTVALLGGGLLAAGLIRRRKRT